MGMEMEVVVASDVPVPENGGNLSAEELQSRARSEIVRALASIVEGNSAPYAKFLTDLRSVRLDDPASVSSLKLRLNSLSESVSFIKEYYHQTLLDYVLGMSVWVYSGEVADCLLEFTVNLATVNGGCVQACLDMLVRNFLPPSCGLPAFLDSYSKSGLVGGWLTMEKIRAQQSGHLARKEEVLNRVHDTIQLINSLVPTSFLRMQPLVFRRMPHRSAAKEWNVLYLESMLRLDNSGGKFQTSQMLSLVVDNLIFIDVEIRWEDILTDEEAGNVYMFHMDLEEECEERQADANEDGDPAGPGIEAKIQHGLMGTKKNVPTLDEMADKMDLMMDITLQHLETSVENGRSVKVYDALVESFQSTIIDTHKSKFTQFLIFYICSRDPTTCGSRFAALLCDIFTSKTRPPTTRMSAAAYLASYLARAKYLSLDVVCGSLKRMVNWCVDYGAGESFKSSALPDTILHGVFFSACQAVMYTLCFKFKMIMDDLEGKRFLRSLPFQQFVDHRLNPLKVCLPSVVEEFLKQARAVQLLDKRNWEDTKERLDLNSGSISVGDVRLDMFFPFDPYLLRQSDRFIRPNFTYWSMVEPPNEIAFSDPEDICDGEGDVSSDEESFSIEEESPIGGSVASERLLSPDRRVASINMVKSGSNNRLEHDIEPSSMQSEFSSGSNMRLDLNMQEPSSPQSDDDFEDGFPNYFDTMPISPLALPMPAKLPAKLPMKLPPKLFGQF